MLIGGCRKKRKSLKRAVRDLELWIIKVVSVIILTMTVNITLIVAATLAKTNNHQQM